MHKAGKNLKGQVHLLTHPAWRVCLNAKSTQHPIRVGGIVSRCRTMPLSRQARPPRTKRSFHFRSSAYPKGLADPGTAARKLQPSDPQSPIEGTILDGFAHVFGSNCVGRSQVGDGAGHFEDAVVGAGTQV